MKNDPDCYSQFSCAQPEGPRLRGKEESIGAHHSHNGPSIEHQTGQQRQEPCELTLVKTTEGRPKTLMWCDDTINFLNSHRTNNSYFSAYGLIINNVEDKKDRVQAFIYCRREGTSNVLEELIKTRFLAISISSPSTSCKSRSLTSLLGSRMIGSIAIGP